ncbi:MAG TPA: caspase family protein [Nitrospirales bacterium]|jgi:hypothetical protein
MIIFLLALRRRISGLCSSDFAAWPAIIGFVALTLALTGCGQKLVFPRLEFKSEEPKQPSIPLAVRIEIPDVFKQAQLFYRDSCNVPQAIPIGERLAEQLKADAAQVFEKIVEAGSTEPADAVLTPVLETSELELHIPRREIGEYPLKVLIRLRLTVIDTQGKALFNEAIKGEGKWTARTDGTACTVQGVMLPVTESIEKLSDREVESLTQAVGIRDAAIRLRTRQELLATGKAPAGSGPGVKGSDEMPGLSFRASLEDENRNQMLEGGEKVVVRVEVSNSGPGVARGVQVVLSGTPTLVKEFTTPTLLGDIQPGEKKQVAITSTLSAALVEQQTELVVQVTEANGHGAPTRKRFVATVRAVPGSVGPTESVEVLSVDVDQIPAKVADFERRTSYAVVVGIGNYRETDVPRLKYAKHDAEMVGKYLSAVGGFPADNVRILTDDHALSADLQDTFENWLPKKARSSGILFVYLVGNGIAGPPGGEPVLLSYEANRSTSSSRGYSMRRLEEVMNRLPSRLKLIFADLSFLTEPAQSQGGSKRLIWADGKLQSKGRTVVVASSSVAVPSLSVEAGQHGLFTYHFLKALRGQADRNKDGWVDLGEVLSYLRDQAPTDGTDSRTELVVVPDVDPDGPLGSFPLAKSRH